MLQLWYTSYQGYYIIGDIQTKKASMMWESTIQEAIHRFKYNAEHNPNHSIFTENNDYHLLWQGASIDSLSIDNYPELFI